MELAAGHHPQFPEARQPDYKADPTALMAKAKAAARQRNRLILWYCPRITGLHMYRAVLTDRYLKATAFTDPGVVDLIHAKFVPLRMCCDAGERQGARLKPFDFVEPGFIFLTPDGEGRPHPRPSPHLHADWFRAALVAVLGSVRERRRRQGPAATRWGPGAANRSSILRRGASRRLS